MNKQLYLESMKAGMIPEAWSNLWYVSRISLTESLVTKRHGAQVTLPANDYTFLYRVTDHTLYNSPPGEVVMEDTPMELSTHLGFVMRARGNVLVTGLGLGCVIRGLLENPNVEHVTVLENSVDVMELVWPYMPKERLTIIFADALEWTATNTERFDCAWHDLWTDRDSGEPHLDIWHAALFTNLKKCVKRQGAWAFDRSMKHRLIKKGFPWMG